MHVPRAVRMLLFDNHTADGQMLVRLRVGDPPHALHDIEHFFFSERCFYLGGSDKAMVGKGLAISPAATWCPGGAGVDRVSPYTGQALGC